MVLNNRGQLEFVGFSIMFIIVLVMGIITVQYVNSVAEQIDSNSSSSSSNFIYLSSNSLSPVGEGISSLVASSYNNTWLNFDGVGDWVNISDKDYYSINNTGNLSIAVWAKRTSGGNANSYILGKGNTLQYEYGFKNTVSNNRTEWRTFNASGTIQQQVAFTDGTFMNDTWSHFLVSHQEGVASYLFPNGVYQGRDTTTGTMMPNGNQPLGIGTRALASGADNFNGSIDEVRVYNQIIYPAAASRIYQTSGRAYNRIIPVLMLHQWMPNGTISLDYQMNNATFFQLLDFLNSSHYTPITDIDYINYTQDKFTLPEKPIIMIWDDEQPNTLLAGQYMAEKYGYKSVVAITIEYVGNNNYENWTTINLLKNRYNWSIASHSYNHVNFTNSNIQQVINNLSKSKEDIISNTGFTPYTFVFPLNAYNQTVMNYCGLNFTLCFGSSQSLGFDAKYIYKSSNFTNGELIRITYGNATSLFYLQQALNDTYNLDSLVALYKLNENSGSTAYDFSNAINGTILNAVWDTDGILVSLINGVDYTLVSPIFSLINNYYTGNYLLTSWTYQQESSNGLRDASIIRLISILVILGIISFIVWYILEEGWF